MADLNSITLTGRLTKDPELRHTPSGTAVCTMRLAYSTRRKTAGGEWEEKSNYVDVTVWGRQGENASRYLAKGRRMGVQGRLEWREWDAADGTKRQAYDVVADSVVFLDPAGDGGGGGGGGQQQSSEFRAPQGEPGGFAPAHGPAADDDIPF